jgi:hypothetical protein
MVRIPVGTVVAGPRGDIGVIVAHVSKHDVLVNYGAGGTALHCQKKGCELYDKVVELSISKLVESATKSPNKRIKQGLKPHAKRTS